MSDQKTEIKIPFGKHKGKPIEALAGDRKYLEWITGTYQYVFYSAVFKLVQKLNREADNGNP